MSKPSSHLLDVDTQYPEALKKLFAAFEMQGEKESLKKSSVFMDLKRDAHQLLLVEEGVIGFYRKKDRLLIHETTSPAVLGLVHLFHNADVIAVAHTALSLQRIPRDIALEIIEKQGLWREVSLVLGRIIKGYVVRDISLVAQDAYHIVSHYLTVLMALPVEERYATTAVKFVTQRSMLSRSRVMDILKQLNTGNYILIKNGVLIELNYLPEDF
ncbi:helix-turn-helix domain-containing protein [Scandinavium goeteborgense]|uniref:helix-turn-helix domain-containing protein n=1 Tax=Scandinavium goeteborgense TaxID=1851514 RepID=UPI0037FD8812